VESTTSLSRTPSTKAAVETWGAGANANRLAWNEWPEIYVGTELVRDALTRQ
jgi:hypothetical protein